MIVEGARPVMCWCAKDPRKVKLTDKLQNAADKAFDAIDNDLSGEIDISEALKFFKSFGKINAKVLFEEMDENADGKISRDEWIFYFKRVITTGLYKEEDVLDEITQIMNGEAFMHFRVPKLVPQRERSHSITRLSSRIHPSPSQQPEHSVADMKIFT